MRRIVLAIALAGCSTSRAAPAPAGSSSVSAMASTSASWTSTSPSTSPSTSTSASTPAFSKARVVDAPGCWDVAHANDKHAEHVATRDMSLSFVDGDDLLALVNRSPQGALPPDYAPGDLVELGEMKDATSSQCEQHYGACLRKDAALAFKELERAMLKHGFVPHLESSYRSYNAQCWVFTQWAEKESSSFCRAVEQSALPGHSQHQLGTTVDLFTEDWVEDGKKLDKGAFRDGFGCTSAGRWLDEHVWEFGFVIPYPIHPDDRQSKSRCITRWDAYVPINPRTGYRQEPWHLRFIGKDNAAAFHDAWAASGVDTPDEIALEQWLRQKKGVAADADLPVCDGCACGACATFVEGAHGPCGENALKLADDGRPLASDGEPTIEDARVVPSAGGGGAGGGSVVVEVKVTIPPNTVTQPPVAPEAGLVYPSGATFASLVPFRRAGTHHYDDLAGAWRIGVEPSPPTDPKWPWRASLSRALLARTWNRANLILPAAHGELTVRMTLLPPRDAAVLRVTLLKDSTEHGTREIALVK